MPTCRVELHTRCARGGEGSRYSKPMVPTDIQIPGFSLDHQHEVDHYYIFIGNPIDANVWWIAVLSVFGILCGAVGFLAALATAFGVNATRPIAGLLGWLGLLSTGFITLFIPTYINQQFPDANVWWYSLKGYWIFHSPATWLVTAGFVASVLALLIWGTKRKR